MDARSLERKHASRSSHLEIVVHDERRMIGEAPLLIDTGVQYAAAQTRAQDLVVDAPPDVVGPGLAAVRPPGVLIGLGVDLAKAVDVAHVAEQLVEPGALLRQESGVLLVR